MRRHQHKRIHLRSLYLWHRYIGLLIALFLMVMAVTGMMLNHTQGLQLHQRTINMPGLLQWYGIKRPVVVSSYHAEGTWFSQWGDHLYLGQRDLGGQQGPLIGAMHYRGMWLVGTQQRLLILSDQGDLIDRLDSTGSLPGPLSRLGINSQGEPIVNGRGRLYKTDSELLNWVKADSGDIDWSQPTALPAPLQQTISDAIYFQGLNMERVILDTHSGRIFGAWGPIVYDLIAVLIMVSALSGLGLWLIRQWREQQRGQAIARKESQIIHRVLNSPQSK